MRGATGLRAVAALLLGWALAGPSPAEQPNDAPLPQPPPSRPAPLRLLVATPFTLAEPLVLDPRTSPLRRGSLIVVETSPSQLEPRHENDFLVTVDGVPARCLNGGARSGRLVCLVRTDLSQRSPVLVLDDAPHTVEDPSARSGDRRATRLRRARIGRRPYRETEAARETGGATRTLLTAGELRRWIAATIREYSPEERDRAAALERPGVPRR